MSLKAFHLVFICLTTAIAFGIGAWLLHETSGDASLTGLRVLGYSSLVAGAALVVYGRYFLKKLKDISYL